MKIFLNTVGIIMRIRDLFDFKGVSFVKKFLIRMFYKIM